MAKLLDNRGTTSNIFQIGKETALKSTDGSLEVVSSQFPAERKDFLANTASFEGLVLPNAILNATDNRFTKNPISNGYELVYGDKRILITVDQDTGTVESSNGFGIKNSGYVSNCILGFKAPASVSGMVVTMPAGFNINYSDGRDVFDETTNPAGKGVLKSYNSITDTAYTVTVVPTGDDATVSCYVLYDDTAKELFYVNKDQLYYGIKVPAVEDGYTVRRDSNGNEYYRLVDGAWVKRHLMRVASFDLTDGKTLENFEPCYPCDLLKLTDYLVADSGGSGSGQKGVIRSMEIPASTTETTSIALDYACEDKNAMLVLVEHTVVPPSSYNISANGKTLLFVSPVSAGMRIDLRWFSSIDVIKVDVPLASDIDFMQGTSEALAPTVKQVHQYNGTKLPLFYPSRFPWVANNIEWLRADTFSWQSGDVYSAAYAELLNIYNAEGGTTETETIGSQTITYKRCSNGMKVADATQQQAIMNVFVSTGSAFYFILDTANTRFKLPRTKYPLVGYEDGLGNYISQEAASGTDVKIAGNQSYLYFYMGTYNQSAIDNTAGLNTELFAGKADVDLANLSDAGKGRLGVGLELMDVIFAPLGIDESKNKRRYLNGQLIIQEQFPAFTAAVKARMATMANAFTTEENWQAEKTNSKLGQCGKFVVDDTAGTIRLPCVVNAQGLADLALIGGIKSESLPNITGDFGNVIGNNATDCFEIKSSQNLTVDGSNSRQTSVVSFDASRSSSAYQDNAPVQQEAIQYPYCIQVATGVEETLPAIREYKVNNSDYFGKSMYSDIAPDNASWLVSNGQYNARSVYPDYYDWLVEQRNAGIKGFKGNTGYAWRSQTADIRFWTAIRNPSVGCAVYGGVGIPFAGTVTAINPDGTLNFYEVSTGVAYENLVYTESENINNEGTAFANLKFANDYDFIINTTDQTFRLPLLNGEEDLPGDSRVDIGTTSPGTTVTVTAPKNGVVFTDVPSSSAGYINVVNTTQSGSLATEGQTGSVHAAAADIYSGVRARKGDKINVYASSQTSAAQIRFTPAIGNGTLYYYVGDTVQDASLINAGAVLGQLSDKISRTAASDKEMVVGWGMPDYSAGIDISGYKSSDNQFTAPKDGILSIVVNSNSGGEVYIGNTVRAFANNNDSYARVPITLPISKGEKFYAPYVLNTAKCTSCFYPFKGVN